MTLAEVYSVRRERVLVPLAERLQDAIADHLSSCQNIDRVVARAKGIDSFVSKATKEATPGLRKYSEPLIQVQDQVGARVVVRFRSDVDAVVEALRRYFTPIEDQQLIPESEAEFGYVGRHFVMAMPDDVVDEACASETPRFFELQVKTLFQHAWSEASHGVAYKPERPLTSNQKRRVAFTAAQAWGADQMFEELRRELATSVGEQ